MDSIAHILLGLLALNLAAFLAFWWDKRLAEAGSWRISERTLLWLALLGGSLGAVSAQQIFRHKTRKEPFRTLLYLIVFLQITIGASWLLAPDLVAGLIRRLAS
ncbi:hypothetical protein ASD64_02285 [Mesorhizobium sp. Root157]|uniref:DUF1294 domain-containing protein n=1 Tax=Mesorhizobium sp. Root157 TaxID=1736477 RepID=UPI0006FF6D9B|nr:DUF1294 domain-containing protein [Mesorhizobium sp. Root157]KRA00410.1 hypothetical protein ASD64_02285 [Mesorhizobium sp. Root157]